jgi:hypothetical protein
MEANSSSVQSVIRQRIETMPLGEPFTPREFLDCGARGAVDQALRRLVGEGVIARVTRGIYARPEYCDFGDKLMAMPETIKIAKTTGNIITAQGADAANLLQLSTQVPMQPVYLTSGRTRKIQYGNQVIRLKHVCARKLVLAGRPAGLALSALWYLGKEDVTPAVIGKIRDNLPEGEFEALESATTAMPAWMSAALIQFKEAEGNARCRAQ